MVLQKYKKYVILNLMFIKLGPFLLIIHFDKLILITKIFRSSPYSPFLHVLLSYYYKTIIFSTQYKITQMLIVQILFLIGMAKFSENV